MTGQQILDLLQDRKQEGSGRAKKQTLYKYLAHITHFSASPKICLVQGKHIALMERAFNLME